MTESPIQNESMQQSQFNMTAPMIRWAGSKRQTVSVLSSYWKDSYKTYFEPFLGSGVLFFHLAPKSAVIGDINEDLMQAYSEVRNNLDGFLVALKSLKRGSRSRYNYLRSADPSGLEPSERAARFVYLNRYCFNGIYRVNRSGQFNVPYGGKGVGPMPSEEHFRKCAAILRRATLSRVSIFPTPRVR